MELSPLNLFFKTLREGGRKQFLFILGAGASVDSGLLTYRGPNGLYKDLDLCDPSSSPVHYNTLRSEESIKTMWEFVSPLYTDIQKSSPGFTYKVIEKLLGTAEKSLIVTQNIDGFAKTLEKDGKVEVVELHGSHEMMICLACGEKTKTNTEKLECPSCNVAGKMRPDVVLFGEQLCDKKVTRLIF